MAATEVDAVANMMADAKMVDVKTDAKVADTKEDAKKNIKEDAEEDQVVCEHANSVDCYFDAKYALVFLLDTYTTLGFDATPKVECELSFIFPDRQGDLPWIIDAASNC